MSNASERDAEELSALADGELDVESVAQACRRWHAGAASHATWHAYHLIGDVLRSEDLATAPSRDLASFAKVRERLAAETPVPAAASALELQRARPSMQRAARQSLPWRTVAVIAAGFATVAGSLFVLRSPLVDPGADSSSLARAEKPAPELAGLSDAASRPAEREPVLSKADGKIMRDARLDRYLDAHNHFSGSSALGVPSAFLRSSTSDAANR